MNIVSGDALLRAMAGLTSTRGGPPNPNSNSTNQASPAQPARPQPPARAAGQVATTRPVTAPERTVRLQAGDGAPPEFRANAPRGTYIDINV